MTLTGRDLKKLWLPLLVALVMWVIAGLIAWNSWGDASKAERERDAALVARTQIEQSLRQIRSEEQDIRNRTQLLQQLQNAGFTGEERRLDWMEMLRETQRELRIPGMNYEFGAQSALDKGDDPAYAWFSSPMRVQLRLLHEEDLLNFLAYIQNHAKALVIVRSCKLAPASRQNDAREAMALLGAECEMQWITARRASEKK